MTQHVETHPVDPWGLGDPEPDLEPDPSWETIGEVLASLQAQPEPAHGPEALWRLLADCWVAAAHGGEGRVWDGESWRSVWRAYCSAGGCDACRKPGAVHLLLGAADLARWEREQAWDRDRARWMASR